MFCFRQTKLDYSFITKKTKIKKIKLVKVVKIIKVRINRELIKKVDTVILSCFSSANYKDSGRV